jgi:hypothetical protein
MSKVNIENITLPGGIPEVVITYREGDAVALEPGKRISITGNINSPLEFYKKRKPAPATCHAVVSKAGRSIRLEVEESCVHQGATVIGKLELCKEIAAFHINTTKRFSHKELIDLLKQYSFIFPDKDAVKKLISELQSFKVTVQKTVEDIDNQKGSVKKLTEWKAAEDITFSFKIQYPVYSGTANVCFNVEACLDVTDRDVAYYLVSGELVELMENIFQTTVQSQLDQLSEIVLITE